MKRVYYFFTAKDYCTIIASKNGDNEVFLSKKILTGATGCCDAKHKIQGVV